MKADPIGLLPLDKPEGRTSHDIVDAVRRSLNVRRVGHTGTLDPFASGLLILCVGWATRLAEYVTSLAKLYRGVIRLGERTDTDDRTGAVVARSDGWQGLDAAAIRAALATQIGSIDQVPPIYSAKRVAGRRAYDEARRGRAVELEPVRVRIDRLDLLELALPDVTVEIECGSGTYVRAVARDVGAELGVGGHLRELRRIRIGGFDVASALPVDTDVPAPDRIRAALLPPESAVAHLPSARLEPEPASVFRQGTPVEWPAEAGEGPVAVYADGRLVGIADSREGRLRPRKVFVG
jgi:tRNA pseudouridine55 synthase